MSIENKKLTQRQLSNMYKSYIEGKEIKINELMSSHGAQRLLLCQVTPDSAKKSKGEGKKQKKYAPIDFYLRALQFLTLFTFKIIDSVEESSSIMSSSTGKKYQDSIRKVTVSYEDPLTGKVEQSVCIGCDVAYPNGSESAHNSRLKAETDAIKRFAKQRFGIGMDIDSDIPESERGRAATENASDFDAEAYDFTRTKVHE